MRVGAGGTSGTPERRFNEAIAAAKLAQVTDPFWLVVGTQLGAIYQLLGEYEQAVECCDEVVEMEPSFARAYGIKSVIHARTGRCESAVELLEKQTTCLGGDSEALALFGYAYGVWGKRRKALAVLRESRSHYRARPFTSNSRFRNTVVLILIVHAFRVLA